eukprot:TRINITY_DN11349_c0_g1_i2.p1 TRINITY_DN11349_c0_g1~~TRINITY_DN11349_c0_g1_i2.p1  ORF type:complete len:282 (+),score=51.22 TRINITY_DN11349_c0_g1_i2:202-1047(+)
MINTPPVRLYACIYLHPCLFLVLVCAEQRAGAAPWQQIATHHASGLGSDLRQHIQGNTFKGCSDAVVVTRSAYRDRHSGFLQAGVLLLLQVKKDVTRAHLCQAFMLLVVACSFQIIPPPLVVLTDLCQGMTILFMDGNCIKMISMDNDLAMGWALLRDLLCSRARDFEVTASSSDGGGGGRGSSAGGSTASGRSSGTSRHSGGSGTGSSGRLAFDPSHSIFKSIERGRAHADNGVDNDDVANLADLEGFLDEDELHDVRLRQAVQNLLQAPWYSAMLDAQD